MTFNQWTLIIGAIYISSLDSILRELSECQENLDLKPPDGILKPRTFTWLAVIHYLHVTTELPHMNHAPRVVLIHKQFVLGSASDLTRLPRHYKLGNIIFGDYDRDEKDCGLPMSQIKMGIRCQRAYLEMPVAGVIAHPEFSRFGTTNSLAVAKMIRPLKSLYMLPVCMPTVGEREILRKRRTVFLLDYLSSVPTEFESENLLGKKTFHLYTHRECQRHRGKTRVSYKTLTNILCTTGCGVRSGAPIIFHSDTGPFELVGLAVDLSVCLHKSMRGKFNNDPPVYIDVYPYKQWIINVISAHLMPDPYPHNFKLTGNGPNYWLTGNFLRKRKKQRFAWRGRTYVKGNYCFMPGEKGVKGLKFFYSEQFEARADPAAALNINLKISAGIETTILCARLMLPNRLTEPELVGIGGYNLTIKFNTDYFPYMFYFTLTLAGKNSTEEDLQEWKKEQLGHYFW